MGPVSHKSKRCLVVVAVVLGVATTARRVAAQSAEPAPKVFTVQQAVEFALTNYPAVRASLEQYNAARSGVGLAKTSYAPVLNAVAQEERGTRESVLGVLMPQFPTVMTGTEGTVSPNNGTYWVSGMGFLFSWEPFTFGYRRSLVRSAEVTASRTAAQVDLTRLGVSSAVVNASLALLADEQRVKASEADVTRREVFARSVHALVDARLRPGADGSRADAELAVARTQLIEAQEREGEDNASMAEFLGIAGTPVEIQPGPLLDAPPEQIWPQPPATKNPAAVIAQREIDEVQSRISVLNHSYFPHFYVEELTSGRGSNELSTAKSAPGAAAGGLLPSVFNWQAALTAQMNLSDWFARHEQRSIQLADRRQQEALYTETVQTITGKVQEALATLDGARRVAQNTPIELEAAQQSEAQARARFQAGVATIVDVAEAQRLLVQAEIDDSLARLRIWRALAQLAADEGNLSPLLNLAKLP
ncbi:MAG TPA: TolC family protein [Candidatus Acidoferrales bacterium]|nr:TolC family protein [Candidatus Acidoferrales bacterium]